jgi:hypothetical protein
MALTAGRLHRSTLSFSAAFASTTASPRALGAQELVQVREDLLTGLTPGGPELDEVERPREGPCHALVIPAVRLTVYAGSCPSLA